MIFAYIIIEFKNASALLAIVVNSHTLAIEFIPAKKSEVLTKTLTN
jgi:hypothetical protein